VKRLELILTIKGGLSCHIALLLMALLKNF